jgi:hypothetical protein
LHFYFGRHFSSITHPSAQLLIEPIAAVEDSVLTPVQTGCLSDAVTPEDFSSKYLQSGRKYALLFGGASVGEGQVGEYHRSAATASLSYAGSLEIRGQVRALATNADPGDFRVALREPATAEQRGAALALAREIFSQPGEKLQPEFLWIHLAESATDEEHLRFVDHADLFGNGQDEVVATLVSKETQTHRYMVFRRTKDGAHWEQIFRTEPLGCSS